ncbi:AGE family epimerase/isomerase [Paenibacillus amylolyticus]|nr:AGE family epimerase/isomerase [Paenibacillus amylolyticus]WFR63939.1 AGE family epimerase/isomerase [Paenibacillus amylolyticus]
MNTTTSQLQSEIKAHWEKQILPFWSNLKDTTHGGFYGWVGNDLQVNPQAPKGGIATARQLWSFAAAYRVTGNERWRDHAEHAYRFLADYMMDTEHGGMYWMVDYRGDALDTSKHVYTQSFGVYSLSEYYRATGDVSALELAKTLFALIEDKGLDAELPAYKEQFDRTWKEQPNEMLSENGVIADYTMNTHIHVLEAYTTLYRVWPDQQVKAALERLLGILYERVYDQDTKFLGVFFNKQWASIIDLRSFGHDIEASWLIDEALNVLGMEQHPEYAAMVTDIAYNISNVAVDADGSLLNEQEGEHIDEKRIWWVQAEAMVGFYNAYQRTGDPLFLERVERLWSYTKENIIDQRAGGEWYWSVDGNGTPDQSEIAGPWKCPYHNSRFCIELIERMGSE